MRRLFVFSIAAVIATGVGFALAQTPAKPAQKPAASTPGQGAKPSASTAKPRVSMPPVPNPGFAPPRPLDQMRAIYEFAAQHPEVLKFVPCYCGCESTGHPHNESCFVKSRDAQGNVTQWDTHGYG